MQLIMTDRGFEVVQHPTNLDPNTSTRLVQQSSQIGDYPDSAGSPGTSYLWVGKDHHLNRGEVAELAARLRAWLAAGSLELPAD
jgi:hypothetical protein